METGVSSYEMVSDEFTGKMIPKSGFEGQNGVCQVTRALQKGKARETAAFVYRCVDLHVYTSFLQVTKKNKLHRCFVYVLGTNSISCISSMPGRANSGIRNVHR